MKKLLGMVLLIAALCGTAIADTEVFGASADVGNQLPIMSSFNSTSNSGKTTLVSAGSPVNEDVLMYFNAIVDDPNDDTVYFVVCNAAGLTSGNCTDTADFVCNTSLATEGALQCNYTADSISGGDAATSWVAYAYAYDGTGTNDVNSTTTYTNHAPTVGGTISITEATVYANGIMTVNIASATKADVDAGDTTTYYYRFLDNDDTTVLQDWSTTITYVCSSDSGGSGNGFCTKADTVYVDVRAQDSHSLYGDGTEETYVETTKGITNSVPVVLNMWIDGTDSGVTVNPTEAGQTSINVTVLVYDYDRANDATEITGGSGWANSTGSYAVDTTGVVQANNATSDYLKFTGLQMTYTTAGGVKTTNVSVYDKTNAAFATLTETYTYSTIYVVALNDSALNFGSFTLGTTGNLAAETHTLSNTGNGVANVTLQGASLTNGGDSWDIGNFTVDDDSVWADDTGNLVKLALSAGPQDFSPLTGIAVSGTYDVWYFVDAPLGLPAHTYSSSAWEWVSSQA